MGNRREYPAGYTAKGICDAWDATAMFPGACRKLTNLIFDQGNPEQVCSRTGVGSPITNFVYAAFVLPTRVTVAISVGTWIYGMVSTSTFGSRDQPFAFNTATGTFTTVSGCAAGNLPSPASPTGDIVQPTMAMVGAKIIVTHPGFNGTGALFFGVIDLTTPGSPAWSCMNTATNALPSVPTSVVNFNNRAWFACGNTLWYSDVLVPTTMTNAGQSLTLGDSSSITAQAGLPIATATSGVVASLLAFKENQIWQITGDAAVSGSLSLNYLSLNVGCGSPRTICQTPMGVIFIAKDGPYLVTPTGQVAVLAKNYADTNPDIQVPFQVIRNPTRAVAAFNASVYRVCIDTVLDNVDVTADYWFDTMTRRWNGPHTWPYDTACVIDGSFYLTHRDGGAALYEHNITPSASSVYDDNGTAISCLLQTCLLPKTENPNVKQVIETSIELSQQGDGVVYSISAIDENFNTLDAATIAINNGSGVWGGGATYDDGSVWGGGKTYPLTYSIPWSQPLVFKKIAFQIATDGLSTVVIGTLRFKYRDAGYFNFP